MRLAVLSSADSWYVRDLQRAAGSQHLIQPLPFCRMNFLLVPLTNRRVNVLTVPVRLLASYI